MKATSNIRVLLADVDGTLLTSEKELTKQTIAAVKRLEQVGMRCAITSGRLPRGMSMLIEPLAISTPIAGFNGGEFVSPDLSVIASHALPQAVATDVTNLILQHGLDAWIYTDKDWLIRDATAPHVGREAWTVKFEPKIIPAFTDEHFANAVKVVGITDNRERMQACEEAAQHAFGDQASIACSQPYYLDVTHALANKGEVVATLSRLLNVAPHEIATIGDMPNDVSMFRAGGYSIAMGNASDEVKAKADWITDGNDNGGFAKAIEHILQRR